MISTSTTHIRARFRDHRLLQMLLGTYALVWVITAIAPLDRHDWFLEILLVANARGFWAYYLPLDVTLAFSALYEIMEMVIATMVAPGTGDAWLGTQGDVWDAQKDMAMAGLGALLCMCLTALIRKLRAPRPVLLAGRDL